MLKLADKVSLGLMSELPDCNVSERRASLLKVKFPVVEPVIVRAGEWSKSTWALG
jgi:hypothetical protein